MKPTNSFSISKVSLPQEEIIDSDILEHNINRMNSITPNHKENIRSNAKTFFQKLKLETLN